MGIFTQYRYSEKVISLLTDIHQHKKMLASYLAQNTAVSQKFFVEQEALFLQSDFFAHIEPVLLKRAYKSLQEVSFVPVLTPDHLAGIVRVFDPLFALNKERWEQCYKHLQLLESPSYPHEPLVSISLLFYGLLRDEVFGSSTEVFARFLLPLFLQRVEPFALWNLSVLEPVFIKNRSNLQKSYDFAKTGEDATSLVSFFLQIVSFSLRDALNFCQQEDRIKDVHRLILQFVSRKKMTQFQTKDIREILQKDDRTLRRYLHEMTEIGLLIKVGDKKGSSYSIVAEVSRS